MRMGIIGGTFDPPHLGHLFIAQEAHITQQLDQVLFVPAGQPWLKTSQPVSSHQHRLEMVRLAIGDNPCFQVSTVDLDRPGPSYSVDTLTDLRQRLGEGTDAFFIVGWDALLQLPQWHEPQRFLSLCHVLAFPRPGWHPGEFAALARALPGAVDHIKIIQGPLVTVSSTDIRRRVKEGLPIRYLVPDAVESYIRQHRLYQ